MFVSRTLKVVFSTYKFKLKDSDKNWILFVPHVTISDKTIESYPVYFLCFIRLDKISEELTSEFSWPRICLWNFSASFNL